MRARRRLSPGTGGRATAFAETASIGGRPDPMAVAAVPLPRLAAPGARYPALCNTMGTTALGTRGMGGLGRGPVTPIHSGGCPGPGRLLRPAGLPANRLPSRFLPVGSLPGRFLPSIAICYVGHRRTRAHFRAESRMRNIRPLARSVRRSSSGGAPQATVPGIPGVLSSAASLALRRSGSRIFHHGSAPRPLARMHPHLPTGHGRLPWCRT